MQETKPNQPKKVTIKEWNAGFADAIKKTLAPNGFKKIGHGPYRNKEASSIPYLFKEHIKQVQTIAANGLNMYRASVHKSLTGRITDNERFINEAVKDYENAAFLHFGLKRTIRQSILVWQSEIKLINELIKEMDVVEIQ